jgi:hypothetical protein
VSATLQLKIPMTSTASWLLLKKNRRGCGSCLARSDTGASRAARSAEAESRGAGYVAGAVAGTEARTPGVDVAYKRDSTGADDAPSCGFPYDGYNFRRRSLDRVVWLD